MKYLCEFFLPYDSFLETIVASKSCIFEDNIIICSNNRV